MQHRVLISSVLAMTLAGAALWWTFGRGLELTTASVQRGTAVEIVYATGIVEPVHWAKVASVVRDRIVEICYCEGMAVAKGDTLVRLDDRELRAQLKELRAREEFLKRELSRVTELLARGSATIQAFERASMDLNQNQALIAVQSEKISDYSITAPMDGIVLRRDGEIGEITEVGQILFRIGVPKPLEVVAEVNEEDIPRVAVGQTALLRTEAFADARLEGKVSKITPMGDSVTKTYRIRLALTDDTPLLPGMSVEANIVSRRKPDALLVPTDSIQNNFVFVVDGSRLRKRAIQTGIKGSRQSEVLRGLNDGEIVASPASSEMKEGTRIHVGPLVQRP